MHILRNCSSEEGQRPFPDVDKVEETFFDDAAWKGIAQASFGVTALTALLQ